MANKCSILAYMGRSRQQITELVHVGPAVLAKELRISVPQPFQEMLPGAGLQRGWATSVVGSSAGRVFAWALLGEVTRSGGWIAMVDVPGISLTAANEVGLSIERVLVISGTEPQSWAPTIGALVGAVDVIVYGSPQHRIQPSTFRKLVSRCRERGTVLMALADEYGPRPAATPPVEVDVSFNVRPAGWSGLGEGHGRLISRAVSVVVSGRRVPGQPRKATFMVPDVDGVVRVVPPSRGPALSVVN